MGFATQERVGSFIDLPVVILEDLSSEVPIGVAHHCYEHVDLFVERIDAVAAAGRRHSRLRRGVVVVIFLVRSGSVWERVRVADEVCLWLFGKSLFAFRPSSDP